MWCFKWYHVKIPIYYGSTILRRMSLCIKGVKRKERHAQWELSQQIRLVAVRGEEKEEGRKKGNFVLEKNFCSNLLMFKQLYIDYVLTNRDFFPAAPFVQVHWSVEISSPRSMVWARSVLIALNAIARYKKGRKGSSVTSLFLCPPIRMCLSVFALWTWLHTAHSWQCTVDSAQCTLYSWHSPTADLYSHSWHSQTAHQQRIQQAAQAQNKPQSRYRVAELF